MILSRYRLVAAALRDPRLDIPGGSAHSDMRILARELYAPARWRAEIASHAAGLAQQLEADVELVRDFAEPLACAVAALATGLQPSSVPVLVPAAQAVFDAGASPDDPVLRDLAAQATARLASYFAPREAALHVQAFVALAVSLPAFVGNALAALLENPDEQRSMREPTAVEELLRFAGPSLMQRRVSRERFELLGLTIPLNQRVELRLAEANRDPDEFADPDRLDLRRQAAGHLAFGGGAHSCVGSPLIRTATAVMLDCLADPISRFRLIRTEAYGGPAIRGHRVYARVL
jgi:cytochrome P450